MAFVQVCNHNFETFLLKYYSPLCISLAMFVRGFVHWDYSGPSHRCIDRSVTAFDVFPTKLFFSASTTVQRAVTNVCCTMFYHYHFFFFFEKLLTGHGLKLGRGFSHPAGPSSNYICIYSTAHRTVHQSHDINDGPGPTKQTFRQSLCKTLNFFSPLHSGAISEFWSHCARGSSMFGYRPPRVSFGSTS